ncbi:hypothetical protein [Asticcacaulis excentricus]|uniref:hypothetical protein n=1 Tax=Asticcacaulis excentricus TaxID=78587 RepID=UPI000F84095A|nr:hypothetical protein [Asticcacaulis excentricus]
MQLIDLHGLTFAQVQAEITQCDACFLMVGMDGCKPCHNLSETLLSIVEMEMDVAVFTWITAEDDALDKVLEIFKLAEFPGFLFFQKGQLRRKWAGFYSEGSPREHAEKLHELIYNCVKQNEDMDAS